MNIERDKLLNEAMGECNQDEGIFRDSGYLCCVKCNQIIGRGMTPCLGPIDFSTPDGFFKLWNWAKEQIWWNEMLFDAGCLAISGERMHSIIRLVEPNTFADTVYNFLKRRIYDEEYEE